MQDPSRSDIDKLSTIIKSNLATYFGQTLTAAVIDALVCQIAETVYRYARPEAGAGEETLSSLTGVINF